VQKLQVTLIDLTLLLPIRTLEFIPGTINFLHFLQKHDRISYGIFILYFILIFFANNACLSAKSGSSRALETALVNRISIRFVAISFFELFIINSKGNSKKIDQ
jgi:hypothetical protein